MAFVVNSALAYGVDLVVEKEFASFALQEKSVTFSNPLFDSNDNFTSSDDESLSDEDVSKDNVKIYLNPFFEFDDEYISSDVNPLFDEVLENIESKDSYDSNLDEPNLLVDDDYYNMEGDILYLEKLLNEDPSPNLPPMKNKDLKQVDATMTKPLIEEPPELELKDLPSHLEYAFLERTNNYPS
nr:reverse transcriptase domain-containing protein [Tanacetum cinerariifolium]